MTGVTAIALFSGGLDSILASRVIMAQGIRVVALKFVTPFFDEHLLARAEEYQADIRRRYGIDVRLVDLSEGYVELVANPPHGYGKHFNPCIDCKIFMLRRARAEMSGRFRPPGAGERKAFRDALTARLCQPTVWRYSGGAGIGAACGMLAGGAGAGTA